MLKIFEISVAHQKFPKLNKSKKINVGPMYISVSRVVESNIVVLIRNQILLVYCAVNTFLIAKKILEPSNTNLYCYNIETNLEFWNVFEILLEIA